MNTAQNWYDDNATDFDPIVFHDGRGDYDCNLLSDSLDTFSLSLSSLDD